MNVEKVYTQIIPLLDTDDIMLLGKLVFYSPAADVTIDTAETFT